MRRFTLTDHFPSSGCADLPSRKIRLRRFTLTRAQIYPHACADLPSRGQLSTGAYLRIYLFSQVAYNYIPVDLYPKPINQHNQWIVVAVYAPASPGGSLSCRPNQRFGCHQNTPQQPHSYNPPRSLISSGLSCRRG